jgi:diaminohydroxyphosphoribosylaminopyrimidine deaminase/5-amino-6-(5-phosphoribosylamino)uracil reductase
MPLFSDLSVDVSDPYLARALALAERGRGTTSPNPMVGCVVVRDGQVVGEGYHERAGGPHAEVVALEAAGERARGATVYVTLEPCNHVGRTPPCVDLLLARGVSRVVIGMPDPDPSVTGGGAAALEAAGVRVEWAAETGPFERLNEAWLKRLRTGLPFVTAKTALTLDGRPALRAGSRSRITGPGGAQVTMALRRRSTAVAVGARTLAIDDPMLTVRDADGTPATRQPLRVVLGRTSVPDPESRVLSDSLGPVLVVVSDAVDEGAAQALRARGLPLVTYPVADGLAGALRALARQGVDDVLVEAGPTLLGALWSASLIDRLVVVVAGGMGGVHAPAIDVAADARDGALVPQMRAVACDVAGDDGVMVFEPLVRG